ncbi:carboxymuconolactone decarboxylase family protein [Amycolatopsis sp.]|jgi:alkylhydroperoxidase family enzyme|uniref:carboxymuconolactone decarboxylase family protein n=1 Tax=Amycolatopsis sp. TaxID=37632 RepID=UPI002E0A092B|nr:carboxymuconolactone decarboxylase family protein [Amycolatopsis sp.]
MSHDLPEPQSAEARTDSPVEKRLTPLRSAQGTAEQRELLTAIGGDGAPNLFSTVARHPALYRTWFPFCMQLLMHSVFPPRERELLIIRTASLCASAYELEHHLKLGAEVGLSDRDLAALTGDASPAWTPREQLLVTAADELHTDHTITDATWHALAELLTTEQLVELPMLVGHYALLAGTLRSLAVPLDSARPEPKAAR